MKNFFNNKKFLPIFVAAVFLVIIACLIGCVDKSYIDENYIEVESLKIDNADDIRLSTYGEPSTYKLNVKVWPENATNKKLVYYIPSEYYDYLTVDESGTLRGRSETEGFSVPVTVTSTTNSKATATFSVKVENVAVERVTFTEATTNLLYNGESKKLEVTYKPKHAVDGRDASFSSLNTSVATVAADGTVTPVGVGHVTIKATCTTSDGKQILAFTSVVVSYNKGQYQLDVAGTPNYNQVIGENTPINFTLLILGDNVDPAPAIEWYVDTVRIPEASRKTQYSHTPDSTTSISYHVYVRITPYDQDQITLASKTITLYRGFSGISLDVGNLSKTYEPYLYGDTATFNLSVGDASNSIVAYKWYLSQAGGNGKSVFVGETYPQNRNLTRRLNVVGDYTLTADAVNDKGTLVSRTQFTFSVEKLVEGDVFKATPKLLNDGLPPDSYHWYFVRCDENGNYDDGEKMLIADIGQKESLYLTMQKGAFRLLVTASINGVPATVTENGTKIPYTYVSDVYNVYGVGEEHLSGKDTLVDFGDASSEEFLESGAVSVDELYIEGAALNGEVVPYLKWTVTGGTDAFLIEITDGNGNMRILDSADSSSGCLFGPNYCFISSSVITLDSVFSVRIKEKGGLYGKTYYYGSLNAAGETDSTHFAKFDKETYAYFANVSYNNTALTSSVATATLMQKPVINGYLSSLAELKEFLDFVLTYRPINNSYVKRLISTSNGTDVETFGFDIVRGFKPTAEERRIFVNEANYAEYAKNSGDNAALTRALIEGLIAVSAYAEKGCAVTVADGTDGKGLTVTLVIESESFLKSTESSSLSPVNGFYFSKSNGSQGDLRFFIDNKPQVYVYDSDELVNVAINGYRPVPAVSDELSSLYKKIKTVVASLIDYDMTQTQIALSFYDYLALNVEKESYDEGSYFTLNAKRRTQDCLEGVFETKIASPAGFAKAYALMCAIAGIRAEVVTGSYDNADEEITFDHVWNKIRIKNVWYNVDAYLGIAKYGDLQVVAHKTFLVSDETYAKVTSLQEHGAAYNASENFDLAASGVVKTISSANELAEFILDNASAGTYSIEIKFADQSKTMEEFNEELASLGDAVNRRLAVEYVGLDSYTEAHIFVAIVKAE